MGLTTLTDQITDVQAALGSRGYTSADVTRWINYGYLDITGAIDFEALTFEDTSQSTAAAANSVNVPTDAHIVKLVRNTTADRKLEWIPEEEYWRLSQATTGSPTKWTRQGTKIYLHPVPTAIEALKIVYKKSPTLLSSAAVTVIPDIWDVVVFMFGVHYGMLARGDEMRAMVWLQRIQAYMATRFTEQLYHNMIRGLEMSVKPVNQAQG